MMLFNGAFFFILVVIVRPIGVSYSDITSYRHVESSLLYSSRFYIALPILESGRNGHETCLVYIYIYNIPADKVM